MTTENLVEQYVLDETDDEFVPPAPHRYNAITLALAAAMLVAAGVFAGVMLQKHQGSSRTTGAASAAGVRAGNFGNFGGGEFRGFGGAAPGGAAPGGAAPGGAAPGGDASATSTVPAVIGSVTAIKGSSLTVRNLGGTSVTVTTSTTTAITTHGLDSRLKVGDEVVVLGTRQANGSVAATAVTVR